jgi:acyl-[acyl-carrier-protein] desaturase
VLERLATSIELLYERHLGSTKEWFPHEYVPRGGADVEVPSAVQSALLISVLTEDGLPYYTAELQRRLGRDDGWGRWWRRWTAEEQRHSIAIREWLHATRAVDPYVLERARMTIVEHGVDDHGPTLEHALQYVAIQELATRTAYSNTAQLLPPGEGQRMLRRIAADENLHYLVYRDLVGGLFDLDPSGAMVALAEVVRVFDMPGTGIPGFRKHAVAVASAGIYNWSVHADHVLASAFRHWRVADRDVDAAGARARDELTAHVERLRRAGARLGARVPSRTDHDDTDRDDTNGDAVTPRARARVRAPAGAAPARRSSFSA